MSDIEKKLRASFGERLDDFRTPAALPPDVRMRARRQRVAIFAAAVVALGSVTVTSVWIASAFGNDNHAAVPLPAAGSASPSATVSLAPVFKGCPPLLPPGKNARAQATRTARTWARSHRPDRKATFKVTTEPATGEPLGACSRRIIPYRALTWKRTWVADIRWHYPKDSSKRDSASLASSTIFVGRTATGWQEYFQFH
jgi:hypothetical protein